MDFDFLQNKLIITNFKNDLLNIRKDQPYLNFKIFNERELLNNLLFTYDDRAKIFLHRLGYIYENCNEILENLYFLKENISEKINELIKIKSLLEKNNLLIKNNTYNHFIKESDLILFHQDLTKEIKQVLSTNNINYSTYNNFNISAKTVYKFNNISDEIRYLFERINLLLKEGISLDQIKLITTNQKYLFALKKYQNFYSFKFNFPSEEKLYQSEDYFIFKSILSTTTIEEAFSQIFSRTSDQTAFNQLFNQYMRVKDFLKAEEIEDYLDYLAKNIKLSPTIYENGIDIFSSLSKCHHNHHIFLLGFALNQYPTTFKDDDYLSDLEKNQLGLSNSHDLQIYFENELIYQLSSKNNLYLSFCEQIDKEKYYPSLLVEKLGYQLKKYQFSNLIYSKEHFEFLMGKVFDEYENFSYRSPYLESIKKEEINYLSYVNDFMGLESFNLESLKLSFTSINTYFECAFKYFLTYVLRISTFKDNINIKIGNIVHKLLENQAKKIPFDLDEIINTIELEADERVFINNLRPQIEKCLDNSLQFLSSTKLDNIASEENNFLYQIDENVYLEGKIDLLIYNEKYFAIIDYKTSSYKFEPNKIELGFSLQLPLYYLLVSKGNSSYANKEALGLYINTVISKDFYQNDYSYLFLNGLTLSPEAFSIVQGEEQFIKQNRGKYEPYPNELFNKHISDTENLLKSISEEIIKGKFEINPKILNNVNLSCSNCNFKDVCYHTYKNYVYLKMEKNK